MSTKQGKKRRRRRLRSLSSRCLKALKVSTNFDPKTVFEHILGKIWMDFPPHGFLLLVLVKCLRELLRLRGLSGSSEEFEFDSVDLRLSLNLSFYLENFEIFFFNSTHSLWQLSPVYHDPGPFPEKNDKLVSFVF